MKWIVFFLLLITANSCYTSKNSLSKKVKLLQKGMIADDTSYIYALPYKQGRSYLLIQGYFSQFSHKERAALDFYMKKGTTITAARKGVVVRMKEDGNRGGWNKKHRPYANYIVIEHEDGSRAGYWHLQHNGVLVNIGDSVSLGQPIGLSGKTGYALFPHLHFLVWKNDSVNKWHQIPTRFQTSKGIKYLKAWNTYKNPKAD